MEGTVSGTANMLDYLGWRGDIAFDERPVNDIDALILSSVSYFDLSGVAPSRGIDLKDLALSGQDGRQGTGAHAVRNAQGAAGVKAKSDEVSLGEALEALLDRAGEEFPLYVRSMASIGAPLAKAVSQARRFADLRVYDYVDVLDDDASLQFSAMQVDITSGLSFVAFRGTDSTLTGWRENFLLGSRITLAQRLAATYLHAALRRAAHEGKRIMVAGHSKGGNLAEYACATCPEELRVAIDCCWSFDGPGFDKAIVPQDGYGTLRSRFIRIQPAYSIVGELFDRKDEPRTYVASSEKGALQHDPMSWQVTPEGRFAEADGLDPAASLLDDALNSWIESIDLDDREHFTNELFDVFAAGGAKTFDEILSAPISPQVIAAAATSSKKTKDLVMRFVQIAANKGADAIRTAVSEGAAAAARAVTQTALEAVNDIAKKALTPKMTPKDQ